MKILNKSVVEEDIDVIAKDIYEKQFNNNSFLITGATGLIGEMLVKGLIQANIQYNLNNRIICLVRDVKKANSIFGNNINYIELIIGDVCGNFDFDGTIDYAIHCASITKSKLMIEKPVDVININVNGTLNILNIAKKHNCKNFVYLSSIEAYGEIDCENCITEEKLGGIDLTSVRSCYPESKRMCENLCYCYSKQYNMNISAVRLTQTFGAGAPLDDNRLFAVIAKSIVKQENIVLKSAGTSLKPYCYTTDAISGIMCLLKHNKDCNTYNLANDDTAMSVYDMAKLVSDNFGNNKVKVVIDIPKENMGFAPCSRIKLDSKKIINYNWKPKYDLIQMYDRLIRYYEENKKSWLN